MGKKSLKKPSKRLSARTRYKVAKKVREHNRKMKKEAKKNPNKRKSKKDPGVPNSLPFKETILQEAELRKKRAEELKAKQKEDRFNNVIQRREMEEFLEEAETKAVEFELKRMRDEDGLSPEKKANQATDSTAKAFYKEFRKVVEASDVVLEVLDARDPLGSRCPQVEETIVSSSTNKRLVLVLNKVDLIPKENLVKWLKHLRNEFPTIAFKASTQVQKKTRISHSKVSVFDSTDGLMNSTRCLGANILMKLLGNYCRSQDIRTNIRVGVVGFPNVGKSSVINSLKCTQVCSVGSTPGITNSMQEIRLDKHIVLLDSPGIILAKEKDVSSVLKNAIKVESLEDPIAPVEAILRRCNREQLMIYYGIPQFESVAEFLSLVARKLGRLKAGGVPNIDQAARTLIRNWNEGKIKYFTHPPESQQLPAYLDARIVTEMSAPFDLDAVVEAEEEMTLNELRNNTPVGCISAETTGPMEASDEVFADPGVKDDVAMETRPEEDAGKMVRKKKVASDDVPKRMKSKAKKLERALELEGNQQLSASSKIKLKKLKKRKKKSDKVAKVLADSLSNAMNLSNGDS